MLKTNPSYNNNQNSGGSSNRMADFVKNKHKMKELINGKNIEGFIRQKELENQMQLFKEFELRASQEKIGAFIEYKNALKNFNEIDINDFICQTEFKQCEEQLSKVTQEIVKYLDSNKESNKNVTEDQEQIIFKQIKDMSEDKPFSKSKKAYLEFLKKYQKKEVKFEEDPETNLKGVHFLEYKKNRYKMLKSGNVRYMEHKRRRDREIVIKQQIGKLKERESKLKTQAQQKSNYSTFTSFSPINDCKNLKKPNTVSTGNNETLFSLLDDIDPDEEREEGEDDGEGNQEGDDETTKVELYGIENMNRSIHESNSHELVKSHNNSLSEIDKPASPKKIDLFKLQQAQKEDQDEVNCKSPSKTDSPTRSKILKREKFFPQPIPEVEEENHEHQKSHKLLHNNFQGKDDYMNNTAKTEDFGPLLSPSVDLDPNILYIDDKESLTPSKYPHKGEFSKGIQKLNSARKKSHSLHLTPIKAHGDDNESSESNSALLAENAALIKNSGNIPEIALKGIKEEKRKIHIPRLSMENTSHSPSNKDSPSNFKQNNHTGNMVRRNRSKYILTVILPRKKSVNSDLSQKVKAQLIDFDIANSSTKGSAKNYLDDFTNKRPVERDDFDGISIRDDEGRKNSIRSNITSTTNNENRLEKSILPSLKIASTAPTQNKPRSETVRKSKQIPILNSFDSHITEKDPLTRSVRQTTSRALSNSMYAGGPRYSPMTQKSAIYTQGDDKFSEEKKKINKLVLACRELNQELYENRANLEVEEFKYEFKRTMIKSVHHALNELSYADPKMLQIKYLYRKEDLIQQAEEREKAVNEQMDKVYTKKQADKLIKKNLVNNIKDFRPGLKMHTSNVREFREQYLPNN